MNANYQQYLYVADFLKDGSESDLEELTSQVEEFPFGTDLWLNRRWILHAIDCGSRRSIEWMIGKGVELSSADLEGYSPLLSLIEATREDKYELLEVFLKFGAKTDVHGVNDWTPLHLAAARNDVEAMKILIAFGADPSVRTRIDDHATALEEARSLGCAEAVAYLESVA